MKCQLLVSDPAPGVWDLPKITTWTGNAQKEQGPQASLGEEKSTSEVVNPRGGCDDVVKGVWIKETIGLEGKVREARSQFKFERLNSKIEDRNGCI